MTVWRSWCAVALFAMVPCVVAAQTADPALQRVIDRTPHPTAVSDFRAVPHLSPLNQDSTQICWSFATSSFLESEMARLGQKPVRLSVVYPMYQVYIEKAKRFVLTKGESRFSPGDLFTGVLDMVRQYGAMPASVYGEKEFSKQVYDHRALYKELQDLMEKVRTEQKWDEQAVVAQVKVVLNRHVGEPPARFSWEGKDYTPLTFLRDVVRLPWNDYVLVTSFQYAPFNQFVELKVPDNWTHASRYVNVPLDVFYGSLKGAAAAGYSVAFDADFSEPSYMSTAKYGIIPDYDIPASAISQEAREFRFSNGTTTDDHLMQVVGYRLFDGEDWFLVKDSWRTAWKGGTEGYMFFHSSYMKLKALAFLVHKDAVPDVTKTMGAGRD
jgi:bleomycin hydrolase